MCKCFLGYMIRSSQDSNNIIKFLLQPGYGARYLMSVAISNFSQFTYADLVRFLDILEGWHSFRSRWQLHSLVEVDSKDRGTGPIPMTFVTDGISWNTFCFGFSTCSACTTAWPKDSFLLSNWRLHLFRPGSHLQLMLSRLPASLSCLFSVSWQCPRNAAWGL